MGSLERVVEPCGLVHYVSPVLRELGLPHAFPTRVGPGRTALDLGELDADGARELARAAGLEGASYARVHQVHGPVVHVDDGRDERPRPRADAVATEHPGRLATVIVADCVPLLLARRDGSRVAAVHAGWRGLVAGVIPAAAETLGPGLVAAIGPCLSTDRFEVGEEVADAFVREGLGSCVVRDQRPRPHVDLRAAALAQLAALGVDEIDTNERCTWNDEGEFWSHRRDVTHGGRERTGRTGALIGVRTRT